MQEIKNQLFVLAHQHPSLSAKHGFNQLYEQIRQSQAGAFGGDKVPMDESDDDEGDGQQSTSAAEEFDIQDRAKGALTIALGWGEGGREVTPADVAKVKTALSDMSGLLAKLKLRGRHRQSNTRRPDRRGLTSHTRPQVQAVQRSIADLTSNMPVLVVVDAYTVMPGERGGLMLVDGMPRFNTMLKSLEPLVEHHPESAMLLMIDAGDIGIKYWKPVDPAEYAERKRGFMKQMVKRVRDVNSGQGRLAGKLTLHLCPAEADQLVADAGRVWKDTGSYSDGGTAQWSSPTHRLILVSTDIDIPLLYLRGSNYNEIEVCDRWDPMEGCRMVTNKLWWRSFMTLKCAPDIDAIRRDSVVSLIFAVVIEWGSDTEVALVGINVCDIAVALRPQADR
ncbi:unnamed protein product [Vitrella brassicaformis CCMP3155]|uniref:Uncharacterized protein n=1 Tax=Vitrella brassicaformis (strain CCMP3155) TaxID=1169540 RepID=A0A0G4E9Z6_VITBC|nr:unnamed protein product [Vitrella brassicaformis CCMP3155]|eukprot:CEL92270.1 unnamed protein product [Vitrella brassicaformis CCMP3155]